MSTKSDVSKDMGESRWLVGKSVYLNWNTHRLNKKIFLKLLKGSTSNFRHNRVL